MRHVLIVGLMLAVAQPVFAAEQDIGAAFSACMEQAGGVTMAMIDCMGTEYQRQDVRLNKVYQELMSGLSSERKQQLQKAQRLWLKFRDANCDFYYDPDGGSLARVNANDCFMMATEARAKELEGFR
ncbi:MAG: lysozyme inhibitor LprI family protein [Methylococcales bacterium]|nr:lysozyme inhibitor LprI family protein [Methylobacter sp.]MDP2428413.1 lysozyme inhibitor LprI family protein [Methylobacter sp.]MDP3055743.1 lysozyme inhibitor LprI family protein [Methylobacter sp.]MDP3360588.1 lysozyme inhibitor LprI family protein [Methylobacter sp.]MDZ4157144.1 lysozyme inhibitor LprI family protein [Methylococcales bacterium]